MSARPCSHAFLSGPWKGLEGGAITDASLSVQQYKKRFKKWGISKSIKKSEWAGIASDVTTQLQRRGNAAGSKLDITFKGRAIPPKRLATALARYYPQLKLQSKLRRSLATRPPR